MYRLDRTDTVIQNVPTTPPKSATVHVDMGKVVGVLRATHVASNPPENEDEDESTYEEHTLGKSYSSLKFIFYIWPSIIYVVQNKIFLMVSQSKSQKSYF